MGEFNLEKRLGQFRFGAICLDALMKQPRKLLGFEGTLQSLFHPPQCPHLRISPASSLSNWFFFFLVCPPSSLSCRPCCSPPSAPPPLLCICSWFWWKGRIGRFPVYGCSGHLGMSHSPPQLGRHRPNWRPALQHGWPRAQSLWPSAPLLSSPSSSCSCSCWTRLCSTRRLSPVSPVLPSWQPQTLEEKV